jgi:hypothetical protein
MNDFEFIALLTSLGLGGIVIVYFLFLCMKCVFDTMCPKPITPHVTNVLQIRVIENPLRQDEDPIN